MASRVSRKETELMSTKFISRDGKLYLKYEDLPEREVLRAWESITGWYWFGVEISEERKVSDSSGSVMPDGSVVDDIIWFGFVQGFEEEWGYFSQAEIEALGPLRAWEIKEVDLPISGRR